MSCCDRVQLSNKKCADRLQVRALPKGFDEALSRPSNARASLLCCARAPSGHAAAVLPIPLTKSRRRIAFPKAQAARLSFAMFRGQFAQQQSWTAHVRFGSEADIHPPSANVCFTPKRTLELTGMMSALCQKQTHAPQRDSRLIRQSWAARRNLIAPCTALRQA
jgi:hypothetical protein